jgi:ribosomal protein S18 acetylase RimI-like enzyme
MMSMKTEILPFTEKMIPSAGNLLAQRHKRNRASMSLLPARFEDTLVATKAVETLWQRKSRSGYAAFQNGKMLGYLLGEFTVQPWGLCGYVYLPGQALDKDAGVETLQDLYCMLGDDWVKNGCFSHSLYIPATETRILSALFDLGFGKERVDALLNLSTIKIPEITLPPTVNIRRAGEGDHAHLGGLSDNIFRALANPPYWHPTMPEDWDELRAGWSELADDKEWSVWLALENKEATGMIGFHPKPEADTDMLISPRTSTLSVAATKPQARGRGVSTALTWQGLKQIRQDGAALCHTDWISPNLLASRFWPRFGFTDVAYRLSKRVNSMIAWTRNL